ncbi:hypothetical protein PHYPSEUDO_004695 [Phytophthora pseudosyringae]|uniref:PH domain-containing protein n=1 Tax=Phytophthora pseudosyringae TaxID=221518 RepID=A0A8T1VMQ7_9STRA|nr:hypothetical protein PHYPSEUDO_004695 [Phytophthora pseudosyringae]
MAGLDCPMQAKAFNLFWHKAELRLVEQPEPEAPVFAISRPTLFGGREEFLLQYPARLEPPTARDIARHRFTVRHGKKRRSFQAPDAATFGTWLSALELALEPKKESEHVHTPSTPTSTATTATSSHGRAVSAAGSRGANSQGRASTARSFGSRASSRDRTSTLASSSSSQHSHASQPRAPALRLTLERPCFTRDRNNLKLIRLHRPGATIADTNTKAEAEDDVLDVPDTDTEAEEEPEEEVTDKECSQDEAEVELLDVANGDSLDVVSGDDTEFPATSLAAAVVADSIGRPTDGTREDATAVDECRSDMAYVTTTEDENDGDFELEVAAVVEALVVAVDELNADEEVDLAEALPSPEGDVESIRPEVRSAVEALVAAVIQAEDDSNIDVASAMAAAPQSFKNRSTPKSSTRSAAIVAKHKWRPLDPSNSRLIWVRCSAEAAVKSAPRSNPRRKAIKPARRWTPIDPSSTRLIWIRRIENAAARIESRYKASSNTHKWVPLDPDNSRFVWVRRHVVPVGSVATTVGEISSSRMYRHGKQRRQ